ncbi:hypothetical protein [Streptomyces sp. TS71-3]|uniref:hypothetical protein n=1 Tax=Streptomyces sp. TS71-3 TaxID=2733862 RepID=UPI001BB30518|nr:hypothetical protein [Streptomyces sp. TS71-3]
MVLELKKALCDAGIVLPSLGVDPVGISNEPPMHLVELGRVNLETARKLIAVLAQQGRDEGGGED